jgi:hypothetical protein
MPDPPAETVEVAACPTNEEEIQGSATTVEVASAIAELEA